MCYSIWVFFHNMFWHYRGHIVFISSLIVVSSAFAKPAIFTMSDEEREQMKYQKIIEVQSMQVMTLELEPTNTNLLQEQTFVDWQNVWVDQWFDNYYFGTESYPYWIAHAFYDQDDSGNNIWGIRKDLLHISSDILPAMYYTNNVFQAKTEEQLEEVIGKLDKLAGDDGNGNANINVNFQPIQQALQTINQNVDDSRQQIANINNLHLPEMLNHVRQIRLDTTETKTTIADGFEQNNVNLQTSNGYLQHIDNDLHQLKEEGIPINWENGGGGQSYLDQLLGKHFEHLVEDIQLIVDEKTTPEKLDGEYMDDAYAQEQGVNYVMDTMLGAKYELEREVQQIQYTNINSKVYDYDEYNNYYTLEGYEANPPSNDQFIRQKVQDYLDQVTYTTETIKGQVITRLDELKQSTLLTTSFDPKWLVVKKGALSEKWEFPKSNWEVDFSQIKLEGNIVKSVYDWIYYLLAVVIIYKQFSKVV